VETALILFLLFGLLFGIMEFSVLMFDKSVITNAAREGARFGAMFNVDASNGFVYSPKTDAEVIQRVQSYSQGHLVSFGSSAQPTVTVTPDWATRQADGSSSMIQVTVNYQYGFVVLPAIVGQLAGVADLEAEAIMRLE
jgi:Flp pilus assembly protein TadG